MKRAASIEALLQKADEDFTALQAKYQASLSEKRMREDLKVAIKNIFENLRSCLNYIAQDIFESQCAARQHSFTTCETHDKLRGYLGPSFFKA